jgi:hypothetical protein
VGVPSLYIHLEVDDEGKEALARQHDAETIWCCDREHGWSKNRIGGGLIYSVHNWGKYRG